MIASTTDAATGFVPDSALPHRDTLLNSEQVSPVLEQLTGSSIRRCARARTKYRIGESLRVSYLITTAEAESRISLRSFVADTDLVGIAQRSGGVPLPDVDAVAWIYPVDRKLRVLQELLTSEQVQADIVGERRAEFDLVSYSPEKAATLRVRRAGNPDAYLKLFADGSHSRIADVYRGLGAALSATGIGTPRLLATNSSHGSVLISAVSGEMLADRSDPLGWHRLGRALGLLHTINLDLAPRSLGRFERLSMDKLALAADRVAVVRPDVDDRLRRLIQQLADQEPSMTSPDVVLHGDLHAKNVMVAGGEVGFIDLDQAGRGPAAAELGSCLAALRYGRERGAAVLEDALLDGYRDLAPLPSREELAWFIAAALLGERVLRAVNRVRLDGLARLDTVLDVALEQLDSDQAVPA